jgi:hypothetical protein
VYLEEVIMHEQQRDLDRALAQRAQVCPAPGSAAWH